MKKQELKKRELWTCPECGNKFVSRNLYHTCGKFSLDDYLHGKPAEIIRLFEALVKFVKKVGSVDMVISKTRISFMARTRFVSVNGISKNGLRIHLLMPREVKSIRFTSIRYCKPSYISDMKIRSIDDLDDELAAWLRESYAVGKQEFREN